jgi:hypothetical protein
LSASAAFLGGIWYFLPFKRATAVAVIVALVIEFLVGITGQVIVNFDWLVARQTDHTSGLSQTVAWGAFSFMFTIALRCGEKAYDFKRWLLLCCVIAATTAFLWAWYPS